MARTIKGSPSYFIWFCVGKFRLIFDWLQRSLNFLRRSFHSFVSEGWRMICFPLQYFRICIDWSVETISFCKIPEWKTINSFEKLMTTQITWLKRKFSNGKTVFFCQWKHIIYNDILPIWTITDQSQITEWPFRRTKNSFLSTQAIW